MTKKILLSSIVTAFMFSGCLSSGGAQPNVDNLTKEKTNDKIAETKKEAKDTIPTPPESKLRDEVIEEAVVIDDDGTPQVIESVD
jgi:PBP1b-binding outer membrane lipoprotein LpoB